MFSDIYCCELCAKSLHSVKSRWAGHIASPSLLLGQFVRVTSGTRVMQMGKHPARAELVLFKAAERVRPVAQCTGKGEASTFGNRVLRRVPLLLVRQRGGTCSLNPRDKVCTLYRMRLTLSKPRHNIAFPPILLDAHGCTLTHFSHGRVTVCRPCPQAWRSR